MAKAKRLYGCTECGATFPKWAGQCGECGAWNTLVETMIDRRVGPARLIPMPARDAKDIPRFGARQLIYTLGLIVLLAISVPLLVAAVVAGTTDSVGTGLGMAVIGAPFWIGTAWMIVAGRRSRRRPDRN